MQKLSDWLSSLPRFRRKKLSPKPKGSRWSKGISCSGRRRRENGCGNGPLPPHTEPPWLLTHSYYEEHQKEMEAGGSLRLMSRSMDSSAGSLPRTLIRTNPWCSKGQGGGRLPVAPLWTDGEAPPTSAPGTLPRRTISRTSLPRTCLLNASMSSSTGASSGYGSNDSSPESSVHTPDWSTLAPASAKEDKAVLCSHQELDQSCMELRSIQSDDEEDEGFYPTCDLCQSSLHSHSCDTKGPSERGSRPPSLWLPPPPPLPPSDSAELAALDAALASLAEQSDRLRRSVAAAKEERGRRMRERRRALDSLAAFHALSISRRFEIYL